MGVNLELLVSKKGVSKPKCFGKIEAEIKDAKNKKTCGLCVFNSFCRDGKIPGKKVEKKKTDKEDK